MHFTTFTVGLCNLVLEKGMKRLISKEFVVIKNGFVQMNDVGVKVVQKMPKGSESKAMTRVLCDACFRIGYDDASKKYVVIR